MKDKSTEPNCSCINCSNYDKEGPCLVYARLLREPECGYYEKKYVPSKKEKRMSTLEYLLTLTPEGTIIKCVDMVANITKEDKSKMERVNMTLPELLSFVYKLSTPFEFPVIVTSYEKVALDALIALGYQEIYRNCSGDVVVSFKSTGNIIRNIIESPGMSILGTASWMEEEPRNLKDLVEGRCCKYGKD